MVTTLSTFKTNPREVNDQGGVVPHNGRSLVCPSLRGSSLYAPPKILELVYLGKRNLGVSRLKPNDNSKRQQHKSNYTSHLRMSKHPNEPVNSWGTPWACELLQDKRSLTASSGSITSAKPCMSFPKRNHTTDKS